jgi:hypothetical protein
MIAIPVMKRLKFSTKFSRFKCVISTLALIYVAEWRSTPISQIRILI